MSRPRYWSGDPGTTCQVSGKPFNGVMYDASLPTHGGRWANICQETFDEHGCRTGLGQGQKYELQEDGRWLRTAG